MPVSKVPCRYAYNARGKLNRKHLCTERCSWGPRQCSDHLNRTPYVGQSEPPIQITHPPCELGKRYADHMVTRPDNRGGIRGMTFASCPGHECNTLPRHLDTCVCSRCIDQDTKLEQAIRRSA